MTVLLSACGRVTSQANFDTNPEIESDHNSPPNKEKLALHEFSNVEQRLSAKGFEWNRIPSSLNSGFSEEEAERLLPEQWRETRAFSREERRSLEETLSLLEDLRARAYHISVQDDLVSEEERQLFRNRAFISSYFHEWVRLRLGLDKAFQIEERLADDSDISLVKTKRGLSVNFGEGSELPDRWFIPCQLSLPSDENAVPFDSSCEFPEAPIVKHLATLYQHETTQLRRVGLGASPFLAEMQGRATGWRRFSNFFEALKGAEFQRYANYVFESEKLHGARIQMARFSEVAPWSGREFGVLMNEAAKVRLGAGPTRRFSQDHNVIALTRALRFIEAFPKSSALSGHRGDYPELFQQAIDHQAFRAAALQSWLDLKELDCELSLLSRKIELKGNDWSDLDFITRSEVRSTGVLSLAAMRNVLELETDLVEKKDLYAVTRYAILKEEFRRQTVALHAMAFQQKWYLPENFMNLTALGPVR